MSKKQQSLILIAIVTLLAGVAGGIGGGPPEPAGRLLPTPAGEFRPDRPLIPDVLRAAPPRPTDGARRFVVQLGSTERERELLQAIESAGGRVLESPASGFIVATLDPRTLDAVLRLDDVEHVEPYHPAFKIDPGVAEAELSATIDLDVGLWRDAEAHEVARAVEEIGGAVMTLHADSLAVELQGSRLIELAAIEGVRRIHRRLPLLPLAEVTTSTVQTGDRGDALPYHAAGVDGRGLVGPQVLMVLDSGFQLDAADLAHSRTEAGTPGPAHRKVRAYETTVAFGGLGDLDGCDAPPQDGFTHGHVVAATALGRATDVGPEFGGPGFFAHDAHGNPFGLDGVAPGAVLVAYDGQVTPAFASCRDGDVASIVPGDLYTAGQSGSCPGLACPGVLYEAYTLHDARIIALPWGSIGNVYAQHSEDIDAFVIDHPEALVVTPAGNFSQDVLPGGGDDVPDPETTASLATIKNGLAIGASGTGDAADSRAEFSSVGPAVSTTVNRIAPQLMAPGDAVDGGAGLTSEFVCRSNDNDQLDPVACDVTSGQSGTSVAAGAAAGAALLARDYFAQGFHPGGAQRSENAIEVGSALLRAVLIGSAEFMTGENLTLELDGAGYNDGSRRQRFNNEQGYGRIQLDNVLPLEDWSASPLGLLINDPVSGRADLGLPLSMTTNESFTTTFEVADDAEELRVALTWNDNVAQAALRNDLNLTLISPSGVEYRGNYYTDDNDQDGVPDSPEDCGGIGAEDVNIPNGLIDAGAWSLPVCNRSAVFGKSMFSRPFDNANPSEAIFLSPDPDGDDGATGGGEGSCTSGSEVNADGPCGNSLDCRSNPGGTGICVNPQDYRQTELGTWTLIVENGPGTIVGSQEFAVIVAGGVGSTSAVRFDEQRYSCNQSASVRVVDAPEGGSFPDDPAPTDVASRTTIEVLDGKTGAVVDSESAPSFAEAGGATTFLSQPLWLTDGTARDPGNNVLDVRDGDRLRVVYTDLDVDTGQLDVVRQGLAAVDCRADVELGSIVFSQFGRDTSFLVQGGCELSARGLAEYGFPDRYMDAGERISYSFAFASSESIDLDNVVARLSCVEVDEDSPAGCNPDGSGCGAGDDPLRENNPPCAWMTIADPERTIGLLPAGAATSGNFAVHIAGDGPGEPFQDLGAGQPSPWVEMLLHVRADTAGRSSESVSVSRQRLNVDETSLFYSTDFPAGGVETVDAGPGGAGNNDEIAQDPITEDGGANDYRFETTVYSPLTATGRNLNLQSPWDFDSGNGGFQTGLAVPTTFDGAQVFEIANWGEDRNFNGVEDGQCVADPGVACYIFGIGTDPRCPPATECVSSEDALEDGSFTQGWGTEGGCGWQTRDGETGGVWHTGAIGTPGLSCDGSQDSACANYKVISGTGGQLLWWELLVTPIVEKVNQELDEHGKPTHEIEITDWAWNQSVHLRDSRADYSLEIDTDLATLGPVDLYADSTVLNMSGGSGFGAGGPGQSFPSGDPAVTRGYGLFAPIASCSVSGSPCSSDAECPSGESCDTTAGQTSVNGSLGGNREGENSCYFEGNIGAQLSDIGLARPLDDDRDNDLDGRENPLGACDAAATVPDAPCNDDGDCGSGSCIGRCSLSGDACTIATEATECPGDQCIPLSVGYDCADGISNDADGLADLADPDCVHWVGLDGEPHGIDEFVTPAGPYRNHDIRAWNGPDMKQDVLSDIYGEAGNSFQAAIGFLNSEGTPASVAQAGFGLAVDDVVIRWREFSLEPDESDCATTGSCAVIELSSAILYKAESSLGVTVIEPTPPAENDCDLDGVTDGTVDCNQNGIPDIVARASSMADPAGEIVVLDRIVPGEYAGILVVSSRSNASGVLFVAPQGAAALEVTVTYKDEDDGTGNPCPNDLDPSGQGIVSAKATVIVGAACSVLYAGVEIVDNGDGDQYVDTNETVSMKVKLSNQCGYDLHGCTARLSSKDPDVDCIVDPLIDVGDLPDGGQRLVEDAFVWKAAAIERLDLEEELTADLQLTMSCDEIDALEQPQLISLPLDIDLELFGQTPAAWIEGFESGTLSSFFAENLDGEIPGANNAEGLVNGDGFRCQHSDPDWVNSNSYGNDTSLDCYPGPSAAGAAGIYWDVDGLGTGAPDGGRAKTGNYSMYFGIYLGAESDFTSPMAEIESVATTDPINVGVNTPELSWWHQISLMDHRFLNNPPMRTNGRGIVQYKTVDHEGNDTSFWTRLEPYENKYSVQSYDFYFSCKFDPIDDGTTEDDFFDMEDPDRRLGPSSTCHPMFTFSCQGDTDEPFSTENLCHATVPPSPSDAGELGTGTWVKSKVDLTHLRGERIKLRFLVTSIKSSSDTQDEQFAAVNPGEWDNGWWIDDIAIDETLASPAVLSLDDKTLAHCAGDSAVGCIEEADCAASGVAGPCEGAAPDCGPACTIPTIAFATQPDLGFGAQQETMAVPGQPITLDASGSGGACHDGTLLYRFSVAGGPVLRPWSETPWWTGAPRSDTDYLVEVRCSSDPSCVASIVADVDVDCPGSGNLAGEFPETILAPDKSSFAWTTPLDYDLVTGDVSAVSSYSGVMTSGNGNGFAAADPPSGQGLYFVVRESGAYCNDTGLWSSGGQGEAAGRDAGGLP